MNLLWIDYVMISLPGTLLTIWAHVRIARALAAGSKIAVASNLSGAETAASVMQAGGVPCVEIELASGELSNHYDAARRSMQLSRDVLEGRSLTAVAVAAHEAGHAIQQSAGYPGLILRNFIAPSAVLGSQVCWILLAAGLWLGMMRLIVLAIGLFWLLLLIQFVNVPVELDASRRAREVLLTTGIVTADEGELVARVANAVAWTYVASVLWEPSGQWSVFSRRWNRRSRKLKAGDGGTS